MRLRRVAGSAMVAHDGGSGDALRQPVHGMAQLPATHGGSADLVDMPSRRRNRLDPDDRYAEVDLVIGDRQWRRDAEHCAQARHLHDVHGKPEFEALFR